MHYVMIGAGGIGCRLAPELVRLLPALSAKPASLVIVDRDLVEEKNLDRQFFRKSDLGQPKAEVLQRTVGATATLLGLDYPVIAVNDFFTARTDLGIAASLMYLVCVDNHAARAAVLEACDAQSAWAIFGANETTFAESYVYKAPWKGTALDPRVKYPEILTDRSGDPLHPPCTGAALTANPQLGIANQRVASLMTWLLWAWGKLALDVEESIRVKLPMHVTSTETRITVDSVESRLT